MGGHLLARCPTALAGAQIAVRHLGRGKIRRSLPNSLKNKSRHRVMSAWEGMDVILKFTFSFCAFRILLAHPEHAEVNLG